MPDNQQPQELTSFKARTHHGSGQKERYDLRACVYLEDARARGDRGSEVSREMKLSVLRWDCPQNLPSPRAKRWEGDGRVGSRSRALGRENAPIGQGSVGVGNGGRGEVKEAGRSSHGSFSDQDPLAVNPERAMLEDMWMLCNLDENLLFSQFHMPPLPAAGRSSLDSASAAAPPLSSSHAQSKFNGKPSASASSLSSTTAATTGLGNIHLTPSGLSGGALGERGEISNGWRRGPNEPAPVPPITIPQPVKPHRRDERVTFHARPTCHDYLGAWARGRAGTGHSPTRSALERSPAADEELPAAGVAPGAEATTTSGGGREGKDNKHRDDVVTRVVAVGFKSGDVAIVDATCKNSPKIVSVLNTGGAHCQGRVTAVRFVPRAGRRLLVAAFSTGDAYTLDITLAKEAPLGPTAERAAVANNADGTAPAAAGAAGAAGAGSSNGGNGGGGTGGGSKPANRRGSHSKGSSSVATSYLGKNGGKDRDRDTGGGGGDAGSVNLASPPSSSSSLSAAGGAGPGGGRGIGHDGGFLVERNVVEGANPVSRWKVTSDGREVTEMAFAPCEVDGRRLIALAGLDGALRVVDYDEQALVAGFRSWFGGILCLDWSPDGRYIVTGGEDDAVTLWCLETRTCVLRGEGHSSWVTGVVFDFWTSRQPYYRFTSVGEDARLCMWEHDELAGSLLQGGGGGRIRPVPSANMPQRYKSSEKLTDKLKEKEDKYSKSKALAAATVAGNGATGIPVAGAFGSERPLPSKVNSQRVSIWSTVETSAQSTVAAVGPSATHGSRPPPQNASVTVGVKCAALDTSTTTTSAAVGGVGGGRRPLSLPGRGVYFFSGYVGRKDVGSGGGGGASIGRRGSRSGNSSNGGVNMVDGIGGVLLEEGEEGSEVGGSGGARGGGHVDLVSPPLCRQSVPRAEPLCCKKLANYPLSQVTVVRGGVVTLCSEGLLKLWARPTVPPPLPPLGAEQLHRHSAFALREKDNFGDVVDGAIDDHREGVATASPPLTSMSREGRLAATTKSIDDVHDGVRKNANNSPPSSTDSSTTASVSIGGSSTSTSISTSGLPVDESTLKNEAVPANYAPYSSSTTTTTTNTAATVAPNNGTRNSATSLAPSAGGTLDAFINTEILTPRADGGGILGASSGDGSVTNGAHVAVTGVKKKGFFVVKRFFVGSEKNGAGRNGTSTNGLSGSGGMGGRQHDDPSASAFSNANLKARGSTEMSSSNRTTGSTGMSVNMTTTTANNNNINENGGGGGGGGVSDASSGEAAAGNRGGGAVPPGCVDQSTASTSSRSARSTLSNVGNRTINRGGGALSAVGISSSGHSSAAAPGGGGSDASGAGGAKSQQGTLSQWRVSRERLKEGSGHGRASAGKKG